MDFNKFDEFGNPIDDDFPNEENDDEPEDLVPKQDPLNQLSLLPEDRDYYPKSSEVYPKFTTVKHEDEDRMDYQEPIIKPLEKKLVACDMKEDPETIYNRTFLRFLLENDHTIRNIAFIGALGHGKTEFIDCLVRETHPKINEVAVTKKDITNQVVGEGRRFDRLGWTDRTFLEQRRRVSIHTEVVTIVHETLDGKSIALNIIDTPGHVDFFDQVATGLALVDGVAFCVDIVEGLTDPGKRLLDAVVQQGLPIILIITKLDRLILESKLSIEMSRQKIRRVVEEVNTCLKQKTYSTRLSPELGNVVFSAAQLSLCFTTESIGRMYLKSKASAQEFAKRMWGDYRVENTSIISSTKQDLPHPFDCYILEPLYKTFTQVLSCEPKEWSKSLRVYLTNNQLKMNTAPLLRIALSSVFGSFSSFISTAFDFLPSPQDISSGNSDVVVRVSKFVISTDGKTIRAIARVFRGEIKPGMELYAVKDSFSTNKSARDDLYTSVVIGGISISHTRYTTSIDVGKPGMIIVIEKTTPCLKGICTISNILENPVHPILFPPALMKIAIEPLKPDEIKKMQDSILMALYCYPSLSLQVNGNGDHILSGTGELFLDCVMHDIRLVFSNIEVKISDPFTSFCETVSSKSVTICYSDIEGIAKIGVVAEPMKEPVLFDLDVGRLGKSDDKASILTRDGWDLFSAENVWCFGPDPFYGPNILVDETIPPKSPILNKIRTQIQAAFFLSMKEGPLCYEVIRGVTFKIVDFQIAPKIIETNLMTKVLPAMKKVFNAAFLAAFPRLLEPIMHVNIFVTGESETSIVRNIVDNRRGKIIKFDDIAGTQLHVLHANVPLMDSFGMETDFRARTNGIAFSQSYFSHWDLVEGDPMDSSISLRPLEPAPRHFLGREFTMKTRRKKGLPDNIDMSKYCSNELIAEIASLVG